MANESPESGLPTAAPDQPDAPAQPIMPMGMPTAGAAEAQGERCPWCSAGLALGAGLASCPSCGAHLSVGDEAIMPGLTHVAAGARVRPTPAEPVRRSKLLAWISGEMLDDPPASDEAAEALAPPSLDVRREMLLLELEAAGVTIPTELLGADAPDEPDSVLAATAAKAAPEATSLPPDRNSTAA